MELFETIVDAETGTETIRPFTEAEIAQWKAQREKNHRAGRDRLLSEEVDPIVSNPLRWNSMTTEEQQAWADYRQALLDIPQQSGFPHDVVWPTKP